MESKVNYGQEVGPNLIKICKKLMDNQNLCKLLVNTDLDPINPQLHGDINSDELFGVNIRVIPLVTTEDQTTTSKIVIIFESGSPTDNQDIEKLNMLIYVYSPFKEWQITGQQLRPFAIMSEIRRSLQDKRINGLGEISYKGFDIASLTDQMGCYVMRFNINAFK